MKATVGDTASFVAWKFFDYQATKFLAKLSKKDRDVRAKPSRANVVCRSSLTTTHWYRKHFTRCF